MPRYVIAFHYPGESILQKVVELDSEESALRFFFNSFLEEKYTSDDEGYNYFIEDFRDADEPLGNIMEI